MTLAVLRALRVFFIRLSKTRWTARQCCDEFIFDWWWRGEMRLWRLQGLLLTAAKTKRLIYRDGGDVGPGLGAAVLALLGEAARTRKRH